MISSTSSSVRRRLTPQQRQRLLARFHRSQLTQRDFAVRHGIGMFTLSKWLRCEIKRGAPSVKFQEVTLPHTPLRYSVEVVCPKGRTVRLQNSSDVELLPQLLQALPC
jgi:transposase-like protein